MKCSDVRERLSAYADGEIQGRERADIEEHVRQCGDCSRLLASMHALQWRLTETLSETVEPVDITDSVMSLLPVRRQRAKYRWTWAWAAGACLLAALATGLHLWTAKSTDVDHKVAKRPSELQSVPAPTREPENGESVIRSSSPPKPVCEAEGTGMEDEGVPTDQKLPGSRRRQAPPRKPDPVKPRTRDEHMAVNVPDPGEADPGSGTGPGFDTPPVQQHEVPHSDDASRSTYVVHVACRDQYNDYRFGDTEIIEYSPKGTFLCADIYPSGGGAPYRVRLFRLPYQPPRQTEMQVVAKACLAEGVGDACAPFGETREVW